MSITIETMPILCLLWTTVGVIFIIVSMIRLGNHEESGDYYITLDEKQHNTNHLEELLSYYLEEEEKKNQGFRELLLTTLKTQNESLNESTKQHKKKDTINETMYDDIIRRYDEGEEIESIAKNLKKGVGEVKLILSLYSMK